MSASRYRRSQAAAIACLCIAFTAGAVEPNDRRTHPTDCWEIHSLGAMGGDQSLGFDVNDAGQVVGNARIPSPTDPSISMGVGFISAPNGGALTMIDVIGGSDGQTLVESVNNAGQVVGRISKIGSPVTGFVTDPGGVNPRPTLLNGQPRDINNVGQTLWDFEYPYHRAVIGPSEQPPYSNGVELIEVDVIPTVDPAERFIRSGGFNDAGQVAVTAYRSPDVPNDPGTLPVAYRWSRYEGAIQLIAEADYSLALEINEIGQVIGIVNRGGVEQGFVTKRHSTTVEMLGTPGDGNYPLNINNHSQIVGVHNLPDGTSTAYVTVPFFVHRSIRIDTLREVVRQGWTEMMPSAINNRGQIAGYGRIGDNYWAFLLTPLSPMAYVPRRDGTQSTCYRNPPR